MKVQATGITFECQVAGTANGQWLVFSHSIACGLEAWNFQVEEFGRSFRILRYDTRGHGGSDAPPGPYTMAGLVRDAVALFDHFGIARAHFAGLSLGGMTALGLALAHPDRLLSIAVCDARADAPPEFCNPWDDRIAIARAQGMEGLVEATITRWFLAETLRRRPQVVDSVRKMIRNTSVEGFVGCARALQKLDYLPALGKIQVPALILAGDADGPIPQLNREMAAHIPNARQVLIPDAGHISNIEQPERFNEKLGAFLNSLS